MQIVQASQGTEASHNWPLSRGCPGPTLPSGAQLPERRSRQGRPSTACWPDRRTSRWTRLPTDPGVRQRLRLDIPAAPLLDVDRLVRRPAGPGDGGRPAPRNQRGSVPPDAKHRWLADKRQFAPWHYVREALMEDEAGRLVVPPPDVKEQLFTDVRGRRARPPKAGGKRLALGRGNTASVHACGAHLRGTDRGSTDFAGDAAPLYHRLHGMPAAASAGGGTPTHCGTHRLLAAHGRGDPPDHGVPRPGTGLGVVAGGPDPAPARHPPHPAGGAAGSPTTH